MNYNATTATGTLAVTGFGFQPKSIILFSAIGSADNTQNYGAATDGDTTYQLFGQGTTAADQWDNNTGIFRAAINASNRVDAVINSWDADGITFGITKTGSPTGHVKLIITGFKE